MSKEIKETLYRPQPLAEYISNLRLAKKLTLREVEEATERKVSNAYLSQLEHGKIKKPSPDILYELASVYEVPYSTLMKKAGYPHEAEDFNTKNEMRATIFSKDKITAHEKEELIKYLAFLRSSRKSR